MSVSVKNAIALAAIFAVCLHGVYQTSTLDCGEPKLRAWITIWYIVIMAYSLLFLVILFNNDLDRDPNLLIVTVLTAGMLLGVFSSIWVFAGTGWIIQDISAEESCLRGLNLWVSVLILAAVYLFYLFFILLFIYFTIIDGKAVVLRRKFFSELNKMYSNKVGVTKGEIDSFLEKYKDLSGAEPITEVERSVLLSYSNKTAASSDEGAECGVCLMGLDEKDLKISINCKHVFHYECIIGWYKVKMNCPYCRQSFREGLLMAHARNLDDRRQAEACN